MRQKRTKNQLSVLREIRAIAHVFPLPKLLNHTLAHPLNVTMGVATQRQRRRKRLSQCAAFASDNIDDDLGILFGVPSWYFIAFVRCDNEIRRLDHETSVPSRLASAAAAIFL